MFTPPPPQPYDWQAQPLCFLIWQPGAMINLNTLCGEAKLNCSNFRSKEEVQAAFDKKQPGTQGLDGDGDGKVCEWGTLKAKSQGRDRNLSESSPGTNETENPEQ